MFTLSKGLHSLFCRGLLVYSCALPIWAKQTIVAVSQIKEAKVYLDQVDKNTLVLVDIDSTLTTPSDAYLRRHAIKAHQMIFNQYVQHFTKDQRRMFDYLVIVQTPSQLVDHDFPSVIKKLQKKGAKVLACTASKRGPLGSIVSDFPTWRFQDLQRLGIDFSSAFPGLREFSAFANKSGDFPGIEKGIVYCDYYIEKANFLEAILESLNFTPQKIIVIDDKRKNIEPFLTVIAQKYSNTEFIGIEYLGMSRLPKITTSANKFKKKISNLARQALIICKATAQ